MTTWLTKNNWRFEVDAHGLPKVARAFHDRKMGISDEKAHATHADVPNLQAFSK